MQTRVLPLFLLAVLTACAAPRAPAPERGFDPGRDFTRLIVENTLAPDRVRAHLRRGGDAATRNAMVHARLAEIDRFYFDFERDAQGQADTLRARRDQRMALRREIEARLAAPVSDWPLTAAAAALEAYYQAGALPASPAAARVLTAQASTAGLTTAAQNRVAGLVAAIRAAPARQVLGIAASPPAGDANAALILNAYGDAARDDAAVARLALAAAVEEMARSEANLAAWEAALKGTAP